MINWKRYSFNQIKSKWNSFIKMRQRYYEGVPKKHSNTHISCLEREALIQDLLFRLEQADACIESSKIFNETLKN